MRHAFEGNKTETTAFVPGIESFMTALQLPGVTIGAGEGMALTANWSAIGAAGLES